MTHNSDSLPQPDPQIRFFDESAVGKILRYEDLIPAMERALIDFSTGKVLQPVRTILPSVAHQGFFGIMPAVCGDLMGAKLVTLFPLNAGTALPTHQGIIVLLSAATGQPMAVLDGRLITEMRTAAVTAVATNLLASPGASVLAILGSGVQARAHFEALRLVRNFTQIRVWSRDGSHAKSLAAEIGGTAMSIEGAVRGADVVVTVTGATEPILQGKWLKPGVLVNAVGAVGPTRRELDTAAMQGAVVVDSRDAAAVESGDILLARATIYAEIGEILAGKRPKPSVEHTVFKSLGLAVEDLAAGQLVLEKSQRYAELS
jgi:ornithine cyclodeaminase/alanine dehydrogenase-like protein (mu-crystallin family)